MASTREEGEFSESSNTSGEEESEEELTSETPGPSALKFKNDGSFLEMFKKMQDSSQQQGMQENADKKDNTLSQSLAESRGSSSQHLVDGELKKKEEQSPAAQQKKPGLMSIVSLSFSTV